MITKLLRVYNFYICIITITWLFVGRVQIDFGIKKILIAGALTTPLYHETQSNSFFTTVMKQLKSGRLAKSYNLVEVSWFTDSLRTLHKKSSIKSINILLQQ